jgi:H+/gluconate symporter-like permease
VIGVQTTYEENTPPPFPSNNYQYVPLGYGTFKPISTSTPAPQPTQATGDLVQSSVKAIVVAVAVSAVVVASLLLYRMHRKNMTRKSSDLQLISAYSKLTQETLTNFNKRSQESLTRKLLSLKNLNSN